MRFAYKLVQGFVSEDKTPFRELKKGDVFELHEETGEMVGNCLYQAVTNPYRNDSGIFTINVVEFREDTIVEE